MKKNIIYAVGFMLLAGLTSCSSNDETMSTAQTGEGVIHFTLDSGSAKTRATTASEQKEKEVYPYSVYVVAFEKNGGTLVNAVKATTTDAINYTADLGKSGIFDIYVIANANTDLSNDITNLSSTATVDNLFAIKASQTPGTPLTGDETNLSWSYNTDGYFLMVGKNENAKQGPAGGDSGGTDIGAITLTRASVRIDVDATGSDITLSGLKLNKRYESTLLMRTDQTDMTGLDDPTTDYAVSASGETSTAALYTYEYTGTDTELTIVGTEPRSGSFSWDIPLDTPLLRNHLYKVKVLPTDPEALDKLQYTIEIVDWATGETIKLDSNNWDDAAPSVTNVSCSNAGVTITGNDVANIPANGGVVTVMVETATGNSLAKLVCQDQVEGFRVSSPVTDDRTQTFTITIEPQDASATTPRTFTFKAENLHDKSKASTAFTITQLAPGA